MEVLFQRFQLIDGLIASAIVVYFVIGWLVGRLAPDRNKPTGNLLEERKIAATTILEVCKIGITVAGFIFPILVGFLSASLRQASSLQQSVIDNIFAILFWVGLSLGVGLWNMARLPGLVNNEKQILTFEWRTGFLVMFQFFSLIGAVIRSIYLIISQLK